MFATNQNQIVPIVFARGFDFLAKDTLRRFFFRRLDVFHSPGSPESFHSDLENERDNGTV
jgi:hypothetical protein